MGGSRARLAVRSALTHLGSVAPPSLVAGADNVLNHLAVGSWMRANGFAPTPRFDTRYQLYEHLAGPIANDGRVLYLEFGVSAGTSLRRWLRLLPGPGAAFHGFDSFEGLPEPWQGREVGAFSTHGVLPELDDDRVTLHPGWFSDTLPGFDWPDHDQLVVHLDVDLYSSTTTILDAIEGHLRPGSLLVFDEFLIRHDELRAFAEFLARTGMRFRFAGGTRGLEQAAFARIP
jgi:O-methyltransferase